MDAISFGDGELVDGTIQGWPASFIATNYGPQGWHLHVAAYESDAGEESPDHIRQECDDANSAAAFLKKPTKANIAAILSGIGFVSDEVAHG